MTRPTAAMRRAMADAEVGDDVFHDDPTVRVLEEETAALLGKEAALFVPSGCMGNEVAVAVNTKRGDAILLDRCSHLVYHEKVTVTEMLGRRYRFLEGDRGRLAPEQVASPPEGPEPIGMLAMEQTHNWSSGVVYPLERIRAVGETARGRGLPVHLDGARLWNACAATGVAPSAFAACADSVMVCYSKALGAPIGSAVAGSEAFVRAARDQRRYFGGAMRQVGVIAAGALHALRHHRGRLDEDHRRARRLAEGIAAIPGLHVDPESIETNIVIAELEGGADRLPRFLDSVAADGVLLVAFGGPGRFRAVTHLDVDDAGIERALGVLRAAAAAVGAR